MLPTAKHGVVVEIKKKTLRRTTDQNSFYWVCVNNLQQFLYESGVTYNAMGQELEYTADTLHEINKSVFSVDSTAKLDIKAFCEFMDKMFAFWIEKTQGNWMPPESTRSWLDKKGYKVNW